MLDLSSAWYMASFELKFVTGERNEADLTSTQRERCFVSDRAALRSLFSFPPSRFALLLPTLRFVVGKR